MTYNRLISKNKQNPYRSESDIVHDQPFSRLILPFVVWIIYMIVQRWSDAPTESYGESIASNSRQTFFFISPWFYCILTKLIAVGIWLISPGHFCLNRLRLIFRYHAYFLVYMEIGASYIRFYICGMISKKMLKDIKGKIWRIRFWYVGEKSLAYMECSSLYFF